jgi:hypothetical protein
MRMVYQNVQKITQCYSSQLHDYLQSKFTRETNWPLEIQNSYGSGSHSMDNTLPGLVERHFPERIPPIERKWCIVRKMRGRRQCFGALIMRPVLYVQVCLKLSL